MTITPAGNMRTLSEIEKTINNRDTIIPLMQRNYKWSMECAAELSGDLWAKFHKNTTEKYQLNMITIYNDQKYNRFQILDGQQRLITLKLLLKFLEPEKVNFNFSFERDNFLDYKKSRKYFIDICLEDSFFDTLKKDYHFSVDTKRLYCNFIAMLIPLSFRDIWKLYDDINEFTITENHNKKFHEELRNGFICKKLFMFSHELQSHLSFSTDEINKIWYLCEDFNKQKNINDDDSNDEIRVSKYSQEFMELWTNKVENLLDKLTLSYIRTNINDKTTFIDYIKNRVEMLYHETTSEPIDEFLNINENKTRFVISDYIRSSMISDNPIEVNGEKSYTNIENRKLTLEVFKELSNYLYNNKYKDIWDLVKIRYDDFEKNKDINRLKILFSDKYSGTSTRDYVFKAELNRLLYFKKILEDLDKELSSEESSTEPSNWNTYNAVYILLECKKQYRFFNLFNLSNIEKNSHLMDITIREKFNFFNLAYLFTSGSTDPWDISYLLESQLFEEKCSLKKNSQLPSRKSSNNNFKIENNDWCYVSRGESGDELFQSLTNLIDKNKNTILI